MDTETHNNIISALLTDSYKIIMAYSFFESNMHEDHTAFELFFRKCPFGGQYCLFAGLKEAIAYIYKFKFTKEEVDYLRNVIFPPTANPKFFDYLLTLDCSKVQVRAMREGSICFPNEPLLALEGPQAICQIIETPLLNLIAYPTLIATNASRMRKIIGNNLRLVEFGLRRAQGPDGAFSATQYSYLGGFDGTSNVVAGFKLGVPVSGTVAHSYITSFQSLADAPDKELNGVNIKAKSVEYRNQLELNSNEGELAAFITFAYSMPTNFLLLADTYDTITSGVPNFACVAFALQDAGFKPKGIRLDSGDLGDLSKQSKALFKQYGKTLGKDAESWIIVASNDINEEALLSFLEKGHQIDIFGIGTHLVTCQKQPSLGLVYKLVECKGHPTLKLSEEVEKSTLPCQKKVWRLWCKNSKRIFDVITNIKENVQENVVLKAVDPKKPHERYEICPDRVEELLVPVWSDNQPKLENVVSLEEAKHYAKLQLDQFDPQVTKTKGANQHLVLLSIDFFTEYRELFEKLLIPKRIN